MNNKKQKERDSIFTPTSIELAIEEFPKILEKHSIGHDDEDIKGVIDNIEELRTQNPAVYDERGIREYLRQRAVIFKDLVEDYFVTAISKEFPLLSDELFKLKRHITLRKGEGTWKVVRDDTKAEENIDTKTEKENKVKVKRIETSLFAYTPLFEGDHTAKLGKILQISKDRYEDTYRTTIAITAKLPGSIGPNLKNAYRKALSHYFSVLSEMFKNPVAGDIVYSWENLTKPEIGAIWIPTLDSLSVSVTKELIRKRKETDPAMILTVMGKSYLVKTWKVDNEKPFERYLREFSTGDLKGKL